MKSHCGKCSQCIDRRFATLAAGCTNDEDPDTDYDLDLFTGERDQKEEHAQMLYGYVQQARKLGQYSVDRFVMEYPDINRILNIYPQPDRASVAQKLFNLHQRHGQQVIGALSKGIAYHSPELAQGSLPSSCLLRVAANDQSAVIFKQDNEVGQYDLVLKAAQPKANTAVAHLVGNNTFDGFSKTLGPSDCFFMLHLCQSKATKKRGGKAYTVVSKQELLLSFKQSLKEMFFEPPKDGKIERRFNEYMKRLLERMKETPLYGLLVYEAFPGGGSIKEHLGIMVPSERLYSDIKNLSDVLKASVSK